MKWHSLITVFMLVFAGCRTIPKSWEQASDGADPENKSRWVGHWKSDEYKLFDGKVELIAPRFIPLDLPFRADLLLYYPKFSFYRPNVVVHLKLVGRLASGESLQFNAVDNDVLSLEYLVPVANSTNLAGSYEADASGKYDAGTFSLHPSKSMYNH